MHTAACAPVTLDAQAGPVTPFRVLGETGIATRLEASSRTGLRPYVGRQSELSMLETHVNRTATGLGSCRPHRRRAWSREEPAAVRGEGTHRRRPRASACCRLDAEPTATACPTAFSCRFCAPRSIFALPSPTRRRWLHAFVPSTRHSSHSCRSSSICSPWVAMPTLCRAISTVNICRRLCSTRWPRSSPSLTRRAPLVVLIEDWQWADTGSRAALVRVDRADGLAPSGADRHEPCRARRREGVADVDDVGAARAAGLCGVGSHHPGSARRSAGLALAGTAPL